MTDDQHEGDDATPEASPKRGGIAGLLRRHWISSSAVLVIVVLGGLFVWKQVNPLLSTKYQNVTYSVPTAPQLTAGPGEQLLRIDASKSSLSYEIAEKIVGASTGHATGATHAIAGDVAINTANGPASRLGEIVVNVEQLRSDNRLRDARIREDFLESHAYPLVTFKATELRDLPTKLESGHSYDFTIVGTATVKKTTAPVSWHATGTFDGSKLSIHATSDVKLSTFDVGPISISGLVSTSDDVRLTLDVVAVDPTKVTLPTTVTASQVAKSGSGGPSFKQQVMPVLEQNCAGCHNAGQVGAAHWVLQTADDASQIAEGIKVITQARYMPPWPASDKGVPLAHPKSLDAKTIALLAQWADAGGKLDVPGNTPVRPSAAVQAAQPRKDVVIKLPAPYLGSLSTPNDYRCFVLDPKFTSPTFLTGYTFETDQIEEIHHAQVFHISAQQAANAAQLEGKDGQPGWQCFSGPDLRGRGPTGGLPRVRDAGFAGQNNLVAGWAPGQEPVVYPQHSGILMEPGDALVLQIHYHYEHAPTPDQSALALQIEPGTKDIKKLRVVNPLAPVEIPCNPGQVGPLCDRSAALADDVRLYGSFGASTEQGLLFICGKTVEGINASFKDGVATSSCDQHVPQDGTIVGVLGHMHTLGKSIRITLDPGTPQEKILLDIPSWNFDWQMNYGLATPLHVTASETVRIQCTWDRSIDPGRPPKYIVFAEGTEDEMCFGTYAMIPDKQN